MTFTMKSPGPCTVHPAAAEAEHRVAAVGVTPSSTRRSVPSARSAMRAVSDPPVATKKGPTTRAPQRARAIGSRATCWLAAGPSAKPGGAPLAMQRSTSG
ncbi:MAG: hypothetical protein IPN17_22915 [Deltaproteobacteria bacterium]|nr:hypothetical protein [Deltaproteobacteria bacterium]